MKGLCLLLAATLAVVNLAAPVVSVHAADATLTVTTTADLATCSPSAYSLRCAISQASSDGAGDTIAFNIPSSDPGCSPTTINDTPVAVCKIAPTSPLPSLSASSTVVNGYTQPGAAANTNPPGAADKALITVQLDGARAGSSFVSGLVVRGDTDTIEGFSITNFSALGIDLTYANGSTVSGTYLGVAPDGMTAQGNADGVGMVNDQNEIPFPAPNNTIGGTSPAARNLISGNAHSGIELSPSVAGEASATIAGNYVGTDASGSRALGNGTGITVGGFRGASSATIGGPSAALRNVISGNSVAGIAISSDEGAASAIIEGNYVGTDATGLHALGNGIGIALHDGQATIGGSTVGTGNVISGNAGDGIAIGGDELISSHATVQGNFVGTDATGSGALGNGGQGVDVGDYVSATTLATNVIAHNGRAGVLVTYTPSSSSRDPIPHVLITRNAMVANGGLGIDLAPEHVINCASTPPGANDYIPCAVIASATASGVRGTACAGCTVEVYRASNEADDLGHGEGAVYLGSATADSSGTWSLALAPGHLSPGQDVTATATTQATSSTPAETSEFAANVAVIYTPTATPTDTPTDTPAPTTTPTNTPAPTNTPTNTPAPTNTPTNTPAPTNRPTNTAIPPTLPTETPPPSPPPTSALPTAVIKPGGRWISPRNNFVVNGGWLHLAAHAYRSHHGDPPIDHVNFTAGWPHGKRRIVRWQTICTVAHPTHGDVFECNWSLLKSNVPMGPLTVSFDVYDKAGNKTLAPHGTRRGTVHYSTLRQDARGVQAVTRPPQDRRRADRHRRPGRRPRAA